MGALDLDWRAGRILPAACLVGLRRSLARACLGSPSRWHSGAVPPLAPRRNRNRPLVGPPKLACAFCGQPFGFFTGVLTSPGDRRARIPPVQAPTHSASQPWNIMDLNLLIAQWSGKLPPGSRLASYPTISASADLRD